MSKRLAATDLAPAAEIPREGGPGSAGTARERSVGDARTIGRAAMWSMLGSSFGQAMSLLLFLLIARYVSQESFGLMAVSLAVIESIRRLAIDPVASALNARPDATSRDYDACFTMILLSSLILATVLALLAKPFAAAIENPEIAEVIPIVAIILASMGLTRTHDVWLGRHMEFRKLALRTIVSVALGGAVGLTMAVNGFDLWSLVGQQITITVVGAITLWLATPWRPRLLFSWNEFRQNLSQARHISFANLCSAVSQDVDIFFVAGYFGPAVAGVYNAAKRILLAGAMMLSNTVSAVSLSALANIREREARSAAAVQGLAITNLLTLPAFTGLAAISDDVIALVLGPEWADAGPILQALALSGYAFAMHQFCGSVLMVEQRAHLNTVCSAISSAGVLVLCWMAAASGPVMIAWAVSASVVGALPLRMELARRALGIGCRQMAVALLPSVIAAGAMWATVDLLQKEVAAIGPVAMLALVVPAAIVLYASLICLFAPAQFSMASQMVGRILRKG